MTDHEKVRQLLRVKDEAPATFVPRASALVVVDVQRYFSRPDYPFAHVLEKLVPGVTAGYFERVQSECSTTSRGSRPHSAHRLCR